MEKIDKAVAVYERYIFRILGVALLSVVFYGFIGPYMISSLYDELVIGGIVLIVAYTVALVSYCISLYKKFKKKEVVDEKTC